MTTFATAQIVAQRHQELIASAAEYRQSRLSRRAGLHSRRRRVYRTGRVADMGSPF